MSTIYVVVHKDDLPRVQSDNGWLANYEDIEYTEIGKTHYFIEEIIPLLTYLPDETPIFAIDNGTDLKTLGELKQYYSE